MAREESTLAIELSCRAGGRAACRDGDTPVNFVVFASALAKRAGIYLGDADAEDGSAWIVIGRPMLVEKRTSSLASRAGHSMLFRYASGSTVVSTTRRITKLECSPVTPSMRASLLSKKCWYVSMSGSTTISM